MAKIDPSHKSHAVPRHEETQSTKHSHAQPTHQPSVHDIAGKTRQIASNVFPKTHEFSKDWRAPKKALEISKTIFNA